ncbi:hypothetical protein E4U42_003082 [Claviceps africana]|uniref:Uncharacterized protein n=1 Tax=Claviceps africana TaxID=83212 RepID=A0A8K0NJA5_9HYPO|nr:hypothetical protein E4U42_003082 [Claviceps africana]
MPRKNTRSLVKTTPTRQRQLRQTTKLGELDTTPTRPDAPASPPGKHNPRNCDEKQPFRGEFGSDVFEDDLDDGDLDQLAGTQAVSNTTITKGFSWSDTGSGARRSSSVSSGGPSKDSYRYFGIDDIFSSPASGKDALPDTLPLPRDLIHDPLLEQQRQAPMILDFSETATTVLRSSPMSESRLSKSLGTSSHRDFADRVSVDESVCQTPSQPVLMNNNKSGTIPIHESVQILWEETCNNSAPAESARAIDVDVVNVGSAAQGSDSRVPPSAVINPENVFISLDGAADSLVHDEGAILETIHVANDGKKQKRKRKQRPKSPLRFDDDTQEVKDVVKKPARKRNCLNSSRKDLKPSPVLLKNIAQQEEAAEPSACDALVATAECLPTTRRQSSPIEIKAAMHENSVKTLNQHPPNNMKGSIQDDSAYMSFNSQKVNIVDISEEIEAGSQSECPTSSVAKTRVSESNSPCTPPTVSTEMQDNEAKRYAPVTKDSTPREVLSASLQIEKMNDEECFAEKQQPRGEAQLSVQQHNIPALSGLACPDDAMTAVYDQNGKTSSTSKRTDDRKLNLAARRPIRHISISGRGSPIRISRCDKNIVNSMPTEFPVHDAWRGTGHRDCLQRRVSNAGRHESTRSNKNTQQQSNFSVALETDPPKAASTFGPRDRPGPRRSILSELKKEHLKRRIVNGQTKALFSAPADQGRRRLHELVDACMQHLDSKKECITKIADTYAKAGNHCVEKIQFRFERERYTVTRLATEDTDNFSKTALDLVKSAERNRAKRDRLMRQLRQTVSARAASYAHASSTLNTLHDEVLNGDAACLTSSS